MSFAIDNRVRETSTTTGTGTLDLAGAATGYQTFVAGVGDGNDTYYVITDGTDWEVGNGTVTSATPDTLSRTTVYSSSNGDAKVNWSAGTKTVFLAIPASRMIYKDSDGNVVVPAIYNAGMILRGDVDVYQWVDDSTTGLKKARAKASAPASETDGLPLGQTMHAEVSIATSSSGNMDFPLAVLTGLGAGRTQGLMLVLSHSQYDGSGNTIMRGYHLFVHNGGAPVTAYQIWDNTSANMIASVAISVVSSTTLRVAITTGTAHATGGGYNVIIGTLFSALALQ